MTRRRFAAPLALFAAAAFVSLAANARSAPVTVGDPAPTATLDDLNGDSIDLAAEFAGGKTVLVFLRGYPGYQCPACGAQAADFAAKAADFAAAGLRVVLVYPGEAAGLPTYADAFTDRFVKTELPAPIKMVLDPDYTLTNAYGIRWDAPRETAYPSTFVVDGGRITWAKISRTHGGRVKASDALAAAR
ncbi:MAG: redoxin domain-containing protein [Planctomycetota bacterium]